MKTVILCGGRGTRMDNLGEELPKPLIKIGEKPVLWHIMNLYSNQGHKEFILLLGHLGYKIKQYFEEEKEPGWLITFVDTGLDVSKSERISKIKNLINEDNFFLAYGDDLADINLYKLLKFHEYMENVVTITSVKARSDFGILEMDEDQRIINFREKPILDYWMNGGFMVVNKSIFNYLNYGELEREVFERLVIEKRIGTYKHKGNWKSMNTLKDNLELNSLWQEGKAFWRVENNVK